MEPKREAASMGMLRPEDLALLRRVLERTLPSGSTALEREFRAVTLVNLFKAGATDEAELVRAMSGAANDAAPDKAA